MEENSNRSSLQGKMLSVTYQRYAHQGPTAYVRDELTDTETIYAAPKCGLVIESSLSDS